MPLNKKFNVTVPLEMRVMVHCAESHGEAPELVMK